MRKHGEFILLMDGRAVCHCSHFETIKSRLNELYAKDPGGDFIITQVVGTVDKPAPPVIHCVYDTNI